MRRQKRVKLIRQALLNKLQTYDRRIQKMAKNAYKIRQFLETLDTPSDKQENVDATYSDQGQGRTDSGLPDSSTGALELDAVDAGETVLEEQPTELPSN